MDFLRDEHQHRRLGFSHEQVAAWLEEAGLELLETRDLDPQGAEKLTVTLWLARDRRILVAGEESGAVA